MVALAVSSPLRKKQRLSSPTYEDEFDILDGEDLKALDEIEYRLSQKFVSSSPPLKSTSIGNALTTLSLTFNLSNSVRPYDDVQYAGSPFKEHNKKRSLAALSDEKTDAPAVLLFSNDRRSSSPEPPGIDYDTWFLPSATQQPAVFSSASALISNTKPLEGTLTRSPERSDPQTSWVLPSPAALELAQKKLQAWQHETEEEITTNEHLNMSSELDLTYREPLTNVQNFNTGQLTAIPSTLASEPSSVPGQPPLTTLPGGRLLNLLLSRTSAVSSTRLLPASSASSPVTPAKPPAQLPPTPLSLASQKSKSLGLTPRARAFTASVSRPKFVTPFKTASATSETGSHTVSGVLRPSNKFNSDVGSHPAQVSSKSSPSLRGNELDNVSQKNSHSKPGINRLTLATCGLRPETYDIEELEAMGVPLALFTLNDVSDFLYYRFNPIASNITTKTTLGADTVLNELQNSGCHLVTKAWVDNHWCLILWKLSGMTCLDPEKLTRIWCWKEVMKQFHYRYKRELAGSSRPPLSLITTRDTPLFRPLVLCVSRILWTPQHLSEDGRVKNAYPELELTDGWYHIRAKVDETLARATRRRIIRIGCKLICVCSKLETPRNEPIEILDSYPRACLSLCGNSTQLAAWHAKLGFHRTQYIATLNSLTADGGRIPVMDLIITDVYPMAYIEFVPTTDGDIRVGPRNEVEEANEDEIWKTKRAQEASRLQEATEKKLERLEGYIDLLERRLTGFSPLENNSPPSHLESIIDELAEGDNVVSILQNTRQEDIGWLCMLLRQKCLVEREQAGGVIEAELDDLVPPRRVYNFRVLRVKDARILKKPATRTAQLTVWDAASLQNSSSGTENSLKAGQRYLVCNSRLTTFNFSDKHTGLKSHSESAECMDGKGTGSGSFLDHKKGFEVATDFALI
ncbi:hypothetical protein Clacol_007625 [Clathrus columnatus]|uniref:Breast cancer type 2 susceptibility protein n=1 Tax=Clathrus columnatus TaxID=1419009 RepID=A0AAV5AJU2_9AGAM|nr:hypothetical protein Clacol_007625 [Clathrus columnatus]